MTWKQNDKIKTIPKRITAWSNSRLAVFEECPYRAKLQYIDKLPVNERPLPSGQTEHANDRGIRIHKAAEDFIYSRTDTMVKELTKFSLELNKLRAMRAANESSAICEGGWAFDDAWKAVPYDPKEYPSWKEAFETIWYRCIIDCLVWISPTEVIIIDFKTGKRFGNEIKHAKQMQEYQLAAFMRYPDLQTVHVELWYLDLDEISPSMTFTRNQGLKFFKGINDRATRMTTATVFDPTPSQHRCKFCPYKTGENKWVVGTGDCTANPIEGV